MFKVSPSKDGYEEKSSAQSQSHRSVVHGALQFLEGPSHGEVSLFLKRFGVSDYNKKVRRV